MPLKRDPDKTYGQKLIRLFATLLFSGEPKSLIQLSKQLNCSKQTVMKIVDDITRSYSVQIEDFIQGRRKYYRIQTPRVTKKGMAVSADELATLNMCRAFTQHLLGSQLFEEAANGIGKARLCLSNGESVGAGHFADFLPGTIDYTPYSHRILTLIKAMETRLICLIRYRRLGADKAKTFYIKPLKLFSHRDTLYLNVRMARAPGKPYREPDFDPLLPVHRIENVELTERNYEFPVNYDFESDYNKSFGVMKGEPFRVDVEIRGWAAAYVQERVWSPDQEITKGENGDIRLQFSASSKQEVISWIMSLGPEATVTTPEWLKERIRERASDVFQKYC